jgi:hypothetical protein
MSPTIISIDTSDQSNPLSLRVWMANEGATAGYFIGCSVEGTDIT